MSEEIFLIEWIDSYSETRNIWRPLEEIEAPENMKCLSVGWIHEETEDNITIIPHISGINLEESSRSGIGMMTIPTAAIIKRTKLR